MRRIKRISGQIARELNISGPFNIQYLARENEIKVIECNLRASRSFPFVSKVLKINLIDLATRIMLGLPIERPHKSLFDFDYVGVKASQFSFNRLQNADPVLGVDMASTGEVGCLGQDANCALLKAMLSVGMRIPKKNILFAIGGPKQRAHLLDVIKRLVQRGYTIYATGGTSDYLNGLGVPNIRVYKNEHVDENGKLKQPIVSELMHKKEIEMFVGIPVDTLADSVHDSYYKMRRTAVDLNIPLITNARLAEAFINAFLDVPLDELSIQEWSEYK